MTEASQCSYGRFSFFYFFYFSVLGILIPYWGLYLRSLNLASHEIGELLAILAGSKIIAPYLWGWLADKTGKRIRLVQLGSFMAALCFMLGYNTEGYWSIAGTMLLYSFFWNAILSQFDAITMSHLGKDHHHYSVIRSWGSVGFITVVVTTGLFIDQYGARVILPMLMVSFIMLFLASMAVPVDDGHYVHDSGDEDGILQIIRRPEVLMLFVVCFLMQFSHGAYYTFFSIYLEQNSYSKAIIGQYWAWGVIAEIVMFRFMPRLIKRYSVRHLLILSLVIAMIRWTLTAWFVDSPLILMISQTMHAATFGLYHAVAIFFIHRYFTGKLQGRGQALYSSLGFGAGGAMGSLVSGYSWGGFGPTVTYMVSSASVLVAVVIAVIAIQDVK